MLRPAQANQNTLRINSSGPEQGLPSMQFMDTKPAEARAGKAAVNSTKPANR